MSESQRWTVLIIVALVVCFAGMTMWMRACDTTVAVTCPSGARVSFENHGDGLNSVPESIAKCGPK